jgi:hypothetical protein
MRLPSTQVPFTDSRSVTVARRPPRLGATLRCRRETPSSASTRSQSGSRADDGAVGGQRDPAAGVEARDHPKLEQVRRLGVRLGGAVGGMDARALVQADLRQRQVDMAEPAVDHDPPGPAGVGQRVEEVPDRRVLTAQSQLEVRCLTRGVVEHDSHVRASQRSDAPAGGVSAPRAGPPRRARTCRGVVTSPRHPRNSDHGLHPGVWRPAGAVAPPRQAMKNDRARHEISPCSCATGHCPSGC